MHQFLTSSDTAWTAWKRRAKERCLVFPDQEMPAGAEPRRARVGLQVEARDDATTLFVDRGIRFQGEHAGVRQWLEAGEKRFPTFAALPRWIREELAPAYAIVQAQVEKRRPGVQDSSDLAGEPAKLHEPLPILRIEEEALFDELTKEVRGQDRALRQLARVITCHAAKCAPRRPITVLALGPTGVGKTKTAETLAKALRVLAPNGAGYHFLRLDMSEYKERHRVSQLLGAPPGYAGYGDGAQLVDALAADPRTIVLFDEIEKAHPDIWHALMNAMDAGRLSSPARIAGERDVDCRRAIFLLTSNLESESILQDLDEREAFDNPEVVDAVCREQLQSAGIASELVGRIHAFLVFRPLCLDDRAEIAALSVVRVAEEYGLRVERVAPGVILSILKQSRSEGFGARPDEYFVDRLLGECFARTAAAGVCEPVMVCGGAVFRCIPTQSAIH